MVISRLACIHSAVERAWSNSRALSMATAAAEANARAAFSSASLNAGRFVGSVR